MVSRPRPDAPEKQINRLVTRVDRTENAAPLKSTSVTDGRTRFVGNESLLVQGSAKVEGWLVVTGTERVTGLLEVTGTLRADGTIELTGPTTISGDTDITGNATITGQTNITGDTSITGDVSLQGTMSVDGGRIEVGDVVLSEANGGSLAAPLQIVINTPLLDLVGGIHVPQGAVFEGGITATGLLPIAVSQAGAGAFTGAVVRDGIGRLRVVVPD